MFTAKVIESGQNQSVSIQREYRLNGTEVNISKIGDIVMLVTHTEQVYTVYRIKERRYAAI